LTGTPTAPTASVGTSNTQIATTAFVTTATSNALVASSNYTTSQGYITSSVQSLPSLTSIGISGITTTVNGNLIASNMTVYGSTTVLNTYTTETSNLVLSYTGPGYALNVSGQANFQSNVYAPTASVGTSNTQVATTAFVTGVQALSNLTYIGTPSQPTIISNLSTSNLFISGPATFVSSAGYILH
jgi:hypothetical protein